MKIISDKGASGLRQIFRQMFVTEANMNFQIVLALACLLAPVHAYTWAQSCSLIKFAFEYVKVFSLAHKSKNVYNLSDILIRDHDVGTYFTGPHSHGKIFHFAGSGHRSCGEATCYPEMLRISYNFV